MLILLHHDFDHLDLKLVVMVVENVDEDVDKEMVEYVDEEMVEDVEDII